MLGNSVFLSSKTGMLGTFLVAPMVSNTILNVKRELGISLEMLQWEKASSRDDGGTSRFFLGFRQILEFRRGNQRASRVGQGSPISI